MSFVQGVETVGTVVDGAGVAIIALGTVWAFLMAVRRRRGGQELVYKRLRGDLGRSILLGLEVLVAADIIRTVALTPDLQSVGILAAIVLIRTFLSFSLELEITGRWPWQPEGKPDAPALTPEANPSPGRSAAH